MGLSVSLEKKRTQGNAMLRKFFACPLPKWGFFRKVSSD